MEARQIPVKDTKLVGDVAVAMILAALLKRGQNVLLPFGDRHPYDLVIEDRSGQPFYEGAVQEWTAKRKLDLFPALLCDA